MRRKNIGSKLYLRTRRHFHLNLMKTPLKRSIPRTILLTKLKLLQLHLIVMSLIMDSQSTIQTRKQVGKTIITNKLGETKRDLSLGLKNPNLSRIYPQIIKNHKVNGKDRPNSSQPLQLTLVQLPIIVQILPR